MQILPLFSMEKLSDRYENDEIVVSKSWSGGLDLFRILYYLELELHIF